MRLYAIECTKTGIIGLLHLWSSSSGHSIAYNEHGCMIVCGDFEYYMNRLSSGYKLICKFDNLNIDLLKAILGQGSFRGCPPNIKQLITLYGTNVA